MKNDNRSEKVKAICDKHADMGCRSVCPLKDACVMKHGEDKADFDERLNRVAEGGEGMSFPNKAGDHADTDEILASELAAAGIRAHNLGALRSNSGEVKTSVLGDLHGWTFKRAWYYWRCDGPGIEVAAAEKLHEKHGNTVRVAGHCGCPSPKEWFKGLACGSYHVDDAEGLKALADTIRSLVSQEPEELKP